MEILVLHPGALGDIILSLPAVRLLRRQYPEAKISFAGNIDYLKLLALDYADRILPLSAMPLHHLFARDPLRPSDIGFWQSYDRIVSWTGSENKEFVQRLANIHPRTIVGCWRPGSNEKKHVSQLFIDSLKPWIVAKCERRHPEIFLDSVMRREGQKWLADHTWNKHDSVVAISPGAGSLVKRWPLDNFLMIARNLLLRERYKVLIVEGPAEPGLGKQILKSLPASGVILAESVPLNLLAAVLERCQVYVGNDSGISHLAAGLGVACVVLFGPSLPQHWAPLGPHVVVLRDSSGCEACTSDQDAKHTCMGSISVERVWNQLA